MGLRVLIAPDKFKGTLTARAAAEAIAAGWRTARPGDQLELLPMSDGGDGFGEVVSERLGAVRQNIRACDAAHRPCQACWWWEPGSKTAVIETARVIGLAMLPPGWFHPFDLDTFGLGKVLRAALSRKPRRLLVGLGGSATNDGGFGMAQALGWRFVDPQGRAIDRWTELPQAAQAYPPPRLPTEIEMVVAVDVQNPLLGPRGASRVYGPQKGLQPEDFVFAEQCLRRLALLVKRVQGREVASIAGAGAAGGLGFGFAAFLQGRLEPGFELLAREVDLGRRLAHADLVITGEGGIDRSSFMGKGAGQIASRCENLGLPCIGLAGAIHPPNLRRRSFCEIHSLTQLTSIDEAQSKPASWLERLAARVANGWVQPQKRPRKSSRRRA